MLIKRTTLESWLDFYRVTLASKCEGLDDEQLRVASVPPSELTLLGLVQHAAEVERNWFRRVLMGEDAPPILGPVRLGRCAELVEDGQQLSDGCQIAIGDREATLRGVSSRGAARSSWVSWLGCGPSARSWGPSR